ncbi:hypothetical protein EAF00_009069 [Botryotinia globosa]|nr:hypothetical protein EAF00_009069 [Botryotinia globosa]
MKAESQQPAFLWVDAIRIDQNDLIEQAIEVKRMGMIYSSAETVIVWIGAPRIESDALKLRGILSRLDRNRYNSDIILLDSKWALWSDDNSSRAMNEFYSKEWWERSWVLQEIVLAKYISLHHGTISVIWDLIRKIRCHSYFLGTNWIVPPGTLTLRTLTAMERIGVISLIRKRREFDLKVQLAQLLIWDRYSLCSDPRDRLAEDRDIVSPDYTNPIQSVLQDVVQGLIEKRRCLNVICMLSEYCRMNGLPSWAPDFTSNSDMYELMNFPWEDLDTYHVFMASGTMQPSGVKVEANVLSARGIILDVVDGLGSAIFGAKSHPLDNSTLPPLASHKILQQSTTDNSRYPSKNDLLHAIWNTLVSSRTDVHTKATSVSEAVYFMFTSVVISREEWPFKNIWKWDQFDEVKSFHAKNAMLKFGGKSFSDWVTIAMDVCEPNIDAYVDNPNEEFRTLKDRRLLVTASGYIGHVPNDTQCGDATCILYGMDGLVVLRQSQDGTYELIGPCYVHGVMAGELMDDMQNGVFE